MAAGEQDIAVIVQFPILINQIAKTVAETTLGPWQISVKCSYDNGCKHETYSEGIALSTHPLVKVIEAAEVNAKTFFSNFKPVNDWLKNTLPSFSKTFDASAKLILTTLKDINSSGTIDSSQRKTLAKEFGIIQSGLTSSNSQLQKGTAAMTAFAKQQKASTANVLKVQSDLESEISNALQSMLMFTENKPCGQSDAKAQYNVIEAEYKATVNIFSKQFSLLSSDTDTANKAVLSLVGLIVDYMSQIKKVSEDVHTVQSDNLSYFMKQVTLVASTNLWSQLAKQAAKEFGKNETQLKKVSTQIQSI